MIEQRAKNGEFEGFVIFSTDNKGGVQKLLEFLDQGSGEFVLLLDGGEVIWPVCVDVLLDKFFDGVFNPSSTKLWPRNTWHTTSRCSTHLHTPIPTHNPHPPQHRVHANVCAALHLPSSSPLLLFQVCASIKSPCSV